MTDTKYVQGEHLRNIQKLAEAVGVSLAVCDSCGQGEKRTDRLCEEIEAKYLHRLELATNRAVELIDLKNGVAYRELERRVREAEATANVWHKWLDVEPDKSRRVVFKFGNSGFILIWDSERSRWVDEADGSSVHVGEPADQWCYLS